VVSLAAVVEGQSEVRAPYLSMVDALGEEALHVEVGRAG